MTAGLATAGGAEALQPLCHPERRTLHENLTPTMSAKDLLSDSMAREDAPPGILDVKQGSLVVSHAASELNRRSFALIGLDSEQKWPGALDDMGGGDKALHTVAACTGSRAAIVRSPNARKRNEG